MRLVCFLSFIPMLLAWLLPNNYLPWTNFYSDFAIVFGFLLLCLSLHRVLVPKIVLFWIVVALVPLAQWYFDKVFYSGDAYIAFFYLLMFSLSMIAGFSLSVDQKKRVMVLDGVMGVLVLVAVISVWVQCKQWLLQGGSIWVLDLRPGGRPYANLGQPNNLATLLCLGLVGVLYYYSKNKFGYFTSALLAIFILLGIVLTQSRTPWLGAVCALFWLWLKGRSAGSVISLGTIWSWVIVYAVLVVSIPVVANFIDVPLQDGAKRLLASTRLSMWGQMWQAILNGGWWGYGWNQVSVAQSAITLEYPLTVQTAHAHNIILDLLLWTGPIVGGLISIVTACWLASMAVKIDSGELTLLMLAVGLVVLHGMLEFPLEYAYFLLPVGLFIGFIQGGVGGVSYKIPLGVFYLVVLILLSVCMWGWVQYRAVEEDNRLMRFEGARIGKVSSHEGATNNVVLYSQLREYIWFARTKPTPNMSFPELERFRKIAYRYPEPAGLFRYALALAINGQPSLARGEFLRLKGLFGYDDYENAQIAIQAFYQRYPELKSMSLFSEHSQPQPHR